MLIRWVGITNYFVKRLKLLSCSSLWAVWSHNLHFWLQAVHVVLMDPSFLHGIWMEVDEVENFTDLNLLNVVLLNVLVELQIAFESGMGVSEWITQLALFFQLQVLLSLVFVPCVQFKNLHNLLNIDVRLHLLLIETGNQVLILVLEACVLYLLVDRLHEEWNIRIDARFLVQSLQFLWVSGCRWVEHLTCFLSIDLVWELHDLRELPKVPAVSVKR